jgi:hypothetical protein
MASGARKYAVSIDVPRAGGWRAWNTAADRFEQRLTAQVSPPVLEAQIDSETRQGLDYVRIRVTVAVRAADVAAPGMVTPPGDAYATRRSRTCPVSSAACAGLSPARISVAVGEACVPQIATASRARLKMVGILQDQENPHGPRMHLRRLQRRRSCLLQSILNRWR